MNAAVQDGDAGAATAARWTLHEAREGEDEELLHVFAASFGHGTTLDHWRWKYRDAPLRGTVLRRGGEPVAFYGGMPRDVQGPDGLHKAVQNGDVMVVPGERAVFTRKGAFHTVADAYIEGHIGPGRDYEFAYGFPNERHFVLGRKLGLYVEGERMTRLRWLPAPVGRLPWLLRERPLDGDSLGRLDALWEAMRAGWPDAYIPVRDAARWRYRFLERPGVRYELLLVERRFGARALAAVALREHGDHVELLDAVCGPSGMPHAVAAARRYAAAQGKPLTMLCSSTAMRAMAIDGATAEASGIIVPLRSPRDGWPQPYPWANRLWLTGGDSDFL